MTMTELVTGAEFLARSLAVNGATHVFFIDAVLRRTLIELGTLGVQRVLGHSEKRSPTWRTVLPRLPAGQRLALRSPWALPTPLRACRMRIWAACR